MSVHVSSIKTNGKSKTASVSLKIRLDKEFPRKFWWHLIKAMATVMTPEEMAEFNRQVQEKRRSL